MRDGTALLILACGLLRDLVTAWVIELVMGLVLLLPLLLILLLT